MSESLHPEVLQRLLTHYPQVGEAITAVRAVTARAKFPIASFRDLTEEMGGPGATIELAGRTMTFAELEAHVPSYYFPIANVNDLVAKLGDLSKRAPAAGASAAGVAEAAQPSQTLHGPNVNPVFLAATAAKPAVAAPRLSIEEMHRAAHFTAQPAPGVGGVPH